MGSLKDTSPRQLVQLAIAEGATAPAGYGNAIIFSTTTNSVMFWDGFKWTVGATANVVNVSSNLSNVSSALSQVSSSLGSVSSALRAVRVPALLETTFENSAVQAGNSLVNTGAVLGSTGAIFDGADNIKITNPSFNVGGGKRTIEVLWTPTSTAGNQYISDLGVNGCVLQAVGGTLSFYSPNTGTGGALYTGGPTMTVGETYLLAVAIGDGTIEAAMDGVVWGSQSYTGGFTDTVLTLGAYGGGGLGAIGVMHWVRVTADKLFSASYPMVAATAPAPLSGQPSLFGKLSTMSSTLSSVSGTVSNVSSTLASLSGFNGGSWVAPVFNEFNSELSEWVPAGNSTTVPAIKGFPALTAVGTATARTIASTNSLTRRKRIGYVSAATAGSLASLREGTARFTLGNDTDGGFQIALLNGCSDAATVAGARQFAGLSSTTAAPTNVEPSTLTNCIGIGHGAADTNLKLYFGGSAAQTPIDLGANFSVITLSTNMYQLVLYAPQKPTTAGFKVGWYVERLGTDFAANGMLTGTVGTQLPSLTTLLNIVQWRCNNATALAVGMDVGVIAAAVPHP